MKLIIISKIVRYKIYVIPTSQLPNYFLSIPDLDLIPNIEGIFSLFSLFFITQPAWRRNTRVKLSRVTTIFFYSSLKKKNTYAKNPPPFPKTSNFLSSRIHPPIIPPLLLRPLPPLRKPVINKFTDALTTGVDTTDVCPGFPVFDIRNARAV